MEEKSLKRELEWRFSHTSRVESLSATHNRRTNFFMTEPTAKDEFGLVSLQAGVPGQNVCEYDSW